MQEEHQDSECEVVTDGAYQAEHHHKSTDESDVPTVRLVHHFRVHTVGGYRHFGKVCQQVREEDLGGEKRQEGQKEGCARHAEHIAEVGARGHEYILERIGKRNSSFADTLLEDREVLLQQNFGLARGEGVRAARAVYGRKS